MQQIKGAVIQSRLAFVRDHFGEAGAERLLASLPEDDRATLPHVLSIKWYPFDLGTRLDDAIVKVLGGGDPAVFEHLGAASAEKNLATLHHAFLTPGNPHGLLSKARTIYGMYYVSGRREYQKTGDKEAVLTTYDAEAFSVPDCLTVIGWHKKALEMCGARDVRVVEEECRARGGAVCRYRLSWA
jgi:uncharacterized protein (TIGR02265 family)